jgi:hypothetical protein
MGRNMQLFLVTTQLYLQHVSTAVGSHQQADSKDIKRNNTAANWSEISDLTNVEYITTHIMFTLVGIK